MCNTANLLLTLAIRIVHFAQFAVLYRQMYRGNISVVQNLYQCFSNSVPRKLRPTQKIVWGSERNSAIKDVTILKYRKKLYVSYTSKHRDNFCPAIESTGVMSVRQQLSVYIKVCVCVFSF